MTKRWWLVLLAVSTMACGRLEAAEPSKGPAATPTAVGAPAEGLAGQVAEARRDGPEGLAAATGGQRPFRSQVLGVSLSSPSGWKVTENREDRMVMVESPDGTSRVTVWRSPEGFQAARDARATRDFLADFVRRGHPDFRIVSTERDTPSECLFGATYRLDGHTVLGAYHITAGPQGALLRSAEAHSERFQAAFPTLQAVMESVQVAASGQAPRSAGRPSQAPRSTGRPSQAPSSAGRPSQAPSSVGRPSQAPVYDGELVFRSSPDNSAFLRCPRDWKVGGGNWALAADSPDGLAHLLSRTDQVVLQGPPDGGQFLGSVLQSAGISRVQVIRRSPDLESQAELDRHGLPGKAEHFFLAMDGPAGPSYGYFQVIVARTTPAHVVASCTGTLARADVFSANYPLLVTMARSIGPNQEVVMARWKANSDRIMAASRTSSETVDLVISTVDSQMRRDPYAAYNEYLRGEQTVRSDYDGGIYTVDSDVDTDTATDPRDGQSGLHRVPADPNADRRFVDPSGSYEY